VRPLITSLVVVLTAATIAFAGSLATAAPASAATMNHKWWYMHYPPTSDDNRCVYRWITTGPGYYRWRMFSYHWTHPNWNGGPPARRVYLRRATYRWVDCWYARNDAYFHYSRLFNETHGGAVEITGDRLFGAYGDGQTHWGSTLNRAP
jgi:hypothetical protein